MENDQQKSQTNQDSKSFKVAVLCGGIGEERAISLESGRCVRDALQQSGTAVLLADVTPDKLDILNNKDIDCFFVAMHGRFGEDGQLQKILEEKQLIYTGSNPEGCRKAFDKLLSKNCFQKAGVKTPPYFEFKDTPDTAQLEKELSSLADKFVIKPFHQGSSVGVSIADNPKEAAVIAAKTARLFGDCLIEKYISGRELTVGIVCGQVLPIIEIRPKEVFYNFQAKYIDEKTQFLFDTIEDKKLQQKINNAALNCFNAVGLRDLGRVDFILSNDGQLYALEINAIPGLTGHSLVPMAAAKAGISMSQLCTKIIDEALKRERLKSAV